MPVYEYICHDCGPFEEIAPLSRFAEPCDCPSCGASSSRLLSVPQVSAVSGLTRRAHEVNERSADSPKRAKANGLTPSGPRINTRAARAADGSKSLPGTRPWMLSH